MLNAFNNVELHPVGPGRLDQSEQGLRSTLNNYEVTQLTGNNQARVIQFVTRFNW